jgi:uncharacterized Zn finger protein
MAVPASIMVECPMCKDETLHEILAGRIGGKAQTVLDSTVKCKACGHVHHVLLKGDKPVEVPVIISWIDESERSKASFDPEDVLSVDDEFMCGDLPVLITSIESKGARVERAKASDITSIWGKKFEKVRIHFSITRRGKSFSEVVDAVPDEEFSVGDILKVGNHDIVIHSIKIKEKALRRGGAQARDIVRIYAKIIRRTDY